MKIKRIAAMLLAIVLLFGIIAVSASAAQEKQTVTEHFVDTYGKIIANPATSTTDAKSAPDVSGYTYQIQSTKTIHVYAEQHIQYIQGYPDGSVRVERNMSRAEAVTVLYRLYNGNYPAFTRRMSNDTFADVDSKAWYYKELETLYNVGILDDDEHFRPNDPITRAEFAIMCAKYDGLTYLDKAKFSDVKPGHWAYSYINAAAEKGWINGYPDGTFKPDNYITRAEVMSLVNRLFNRPVTKDRLPANVNPYNDITESHWAYCDAMEATVKHDAVNWHGAQYNNGVYNIITEKFIDSNGKEISKPVTTQDKPNYHPAPLNGYNYLGYVTEVTYVYTSGTTIPGIEKTASVSNAAVGDTVKYTITLSNGKDATDAWRDVVVTDAIPKHMSFVHGSVYVVSKSAEYNFAGGLLSVPVGNIEVGKSVKVTFEALVLSTAYGKTITNKATGTGSNGGPVTDSDDSITIDQGKIQPFIVKTPDVSNADIGQTITYTLSIGNDAGATYPWENAVITDAIPNGLSFIDGSVYLDGVSKAYSFKSGTLSVELGDIAPGKNHTLTFKAIVQASAYGSTIYNTAIGKGDNIPDVTAPDDGVIIHDGEALPSASKTAGVATAKVGDTIVYTIKASNHKDATAAWTGAVITDTIPEHVSFVYGSVQVGGKTADYSYTSSTRSFVVELGDIAPGEAKTVTFAVTVNTDAYGKSIKNTAILSGGNIKDIEVSDEAVTIGAGIARMSATKSVDKSTVKVGDTITYTIKVTNSETATVNLENVVMSDIISEYLSFAHGSVQVDGYSAKYSYDNESRKLSVELGGIAPDQTKTITFSALINSTAYGKSFKNTAVLSADNDGDKTASDGGVIVDGGTAEGSVGTKTVSSPTAKVGDTLTYSITLRNASTATAAWTGVEVSDAIPEHLSFISGSVEEDGRSSTDFSYNAGTKTLTLYADSIEIGETKTFTFKVTVQDGAQGLYIVNTAIVSSDDREDIQLPDTGVQIDGGDTAPYMSKSANVSEARPGDIFTYTITVKNGMDATAAWKDVILSDVLPSGVKLVSGSVTLNGQTVSYGVAGQAIEVTIGELSPGEDAIVTFDVRVLDSAVGTTIHNVAVAKGDNGEKSATDNGVTVPEPELPGGDDKTVIGTKTVDKTLVNAGDKVAYTITARNNTEELWTGVQIYDVLDTSVLTLIDDSIYIDGIRYLSGSGKWTFTDRQLVVNLGDIPPGASVKCDFTVKFKNDAVNSTYTNHATIKSVNNASVYVKAPEVVIMGGGGGESYLSYTEVHYKLFIGFANLDGSPSYLWKPNNSVMVDHMCTIAYRMMTDYYRGSLVNGTVTVPESITSREGQFFVSHGIIAASEYSTSEAATQSPIYRLLNFAIGADLNPSGSAPMSRASVASLICDLTGRDKTPNTNGLAVAYFSDKGSQAGLIDEVSNSHDYTLDSNGNETWISIMDD